MGNSNYIQYEYVVSYTLAMVQTVFCIVLLKKIFCFLCLGNELDKSFEKKEQLDVKLHEQEPKLCEITTQYEKLKTLLDQKGYCRTRRQNTSTSLETISSTSSSVRYRRSQETRNLLEYIHGGEEGAIVGAWDFVAADATKETMDTLVSKYRRGKYLEGVISHALKEFSNSKEALTQAIALKYNNFLSRRKSNVICKTQFWFLIQRKKCGYLVTLSVEVLTEKSPERGYLTSLLKN